MTDSPDRKTCESAKGMAEVLSFALDAPAVWKDDEIAAMWDHQLHCPLREALAAHPNTASNADRVWADTPDPTIKTFADLLFHPSPPLGLLNLTKEHAKYVRQRAADKAFQQIASMLYYLCLAAALVHRGERITSLDDARLVEGLDVMLGRTWLDDRSRSLLLECRAAAVDGQ